MIPILRYIGNLEALSKTVRKIHDFKKTSIRKNPQWRLQSYPKYRQNGLFYLIASMQNIVIVSMSAAVLFRSLSLSLFSVCLPVCLSVSLPVSLPVSLSLFLRLFSENRLSYDFGKTRMLRLRKTISLGSLENIHSLAVLTV